MRDLGDRDRYGFYEHTKTLIAAPPDTMLIDEKNIRAYRVPNLVGVVFTTNHRTDGLYLPADDRRHYVAWSDLTPDDFPAGYWAELYRWFDDDGEGGAGAAHVAAYLAARDLRGLRSEGAAAEDARVLGRRRRRPGTRGRRPRGRHRQAERARRADGRRRRARRATTSTSGRG